MARSRFRHFGCYFNVASPGSPVDMKFFAASTDASYNISNANIETTATSLTFEDWATFDPGVQTATISGNTIVESTNPQFKAIMDWFMIEENRTEVAWEGIYYGGQKVTGNLLWTNITIAAATKEVTKFSWSANVTDKPTYVTIT